MCIHVLLKYPLCFCFQSESVKPNVSFKCTEVKPFLVHMGLCSLIGSEAINVKYGVTIFLSCSVSEKNKKCSAGIQKSIIVGEEW